MPGQLDARLATLEARIGGKDDRHADHEEKCGKDEVGSRKAIPVGVVHFGPSATTAVVVHHDHEGDGEAAQRVKRKQPFGCGNEGRCVGEALCGCHIE